jgi:hypothetical protein
LTLDVKKSNSSNETPNVMTVGVEKYGLSLHHFKIGISCRKDKETWVQEGGGLYGPDFGRS